LPKTQSFGALKIIFLTKEILSGTALRQRKAHLKEGYLILAVKKSNLHKEKNMNSQNGFLSSVTKLSNPL